MELLRIFIVKDEIKNEVFSCEKGNFINESDNILEKIEKGLSQVMNIHKAKPLNSF